LQSRRPWLAEDSDDVPNEIVPDSSNSDGSLLPVEEDRFQAGPCGDCRRLDDPHPVQHRLSGWLPRVPQVVVDLVIPLVSLDGGEVFRIDHNRSWIHTPIDLDEALRLPDRVQGTLTGAWTSRVSDVRSVEDAEEVLAGSATVEHLVLEGLFQIVNEHGVDVRRDWDGGVIPIYLQKSMSAGGTERRGTLRLDL
jgi:hypothetical protein